jgi:hypothetical protein
MRHILLYTFILFGLSAIAQSRLDWLLNDIDQNEPSFRINLRYHSAIQPRIITNTIVGDTLKYLEEIKITQQKKPGSIKVFPLVDLGVRGQNNLEYRAMAGVQMEGNFGRKVYTRFSYLHGIENGTGFFREKTSIGKTIKNNLNQKIDLRGRLSYSPNQFINLQGGWDNQFIGEGSRSLFLSDYGKPLGFAMARLNFWRVEYLMLYQFLSENNVLNQRVNKYATSHYLSFNANSWLQIGVFESVVFSPKDTLLNRGFEPEYLNPMIFFRPQEYQLGSSDNSLIGVDAKIKIQSFTLYGQLMLDEFNLADIKGRTRWWANKYAVQMGIKTFKYYRNNKFFLRGEMNIVRPYTYSHLSVAQSYTNQGTPLAHPYGANFSELLIEVKWKNKKWEGELFVSYSLKGYDSDSLNYGGNIFIPYINRPINDFGHKIGQGKGNNALRSMVRVSYNLIPEIHLQAFLEGHFRYNTYLIEPQYQVIIGIRSRLWNDYRNY